MVLKNIKNRALAFNLLDANDISSASTLKWMLLIHHQHPFRVDAIDLLVLCVCVWVFYFFFTRALASTKLDANDISSASTLKVDTFDPSSAPL
jgi:hypothetical protein